MKTKHFSLLLLFTFQFLLLLPNGFTQYFESERMVRLVYFVPNDRTPQPEMSTKLDMLMKDVQQFYADEMERHGFGRKTFYFETNHSGQAVVHRVTGQFTDTYYHQQTWHKVWEETARRFDTSQHIYFTVVDISTEHLGREDTGHGIVCGRGGVYGDGGRILVPASGDCFQDESGFMIAAHELGHAFGLFHDFRNQAYLMSYGTFGTELAQCSAEWLAVHPYFNPPQTSPNRATSIEALPPFAVPPHSIRFRFTVADTEGIHQVQLLTPATALHEAPGEPRLIACKLVEQQRDTLEFVTSQLTTSTEANLLLQVIDAQGHFTREKFRINITSVLPSREIVFIPDVNLAQILRKHLGLPPGQVITQVDMLNLTELFLDNLQIRDLTGLEHAKHLKILSLIGNPIRDATSLAELTNLQYLGLIANQLSDITPLAGLTNLTWLDLYENQIADITPLTELKQLQILQVYGNQITDITPLTGLTQLRALALESNQITDITPLAGLTNLETLLLSNNQISDFTPLIGLDKLTKLYVAGNPIGNDDSLHTLLDQNPNIEFDIDLTQLVTVENPTEPISIPDANLAATVRETLNLSAEPPVTRGDMLRLTELSVLWAVTDLTGIEHAKNLTYLKLVTNQVADFTPLLELKNLTALVLSSQNSNGVVDLDTITQLTQLQTLHLFNYQIQDIPVLTGLKDLISLGFSYTQMNDLTPFAELTQLKHLSLPGNRINDLTPLAKLARLERLTLSNNQIRNITPLRKLTNLEYLNLNGNQIRNISPLGKLAQLPTLRLTDNQISDITPLTALRNLTDLRVAGNPIADKTPLQTLLDQNPNLKLDIDPAQLSVVVRFTGPEPLPLYWVDSETSGFYRLVGTKQTAENVALTVPNITSLAIDMHASKVYWIEQSGTKRGEIGSANLDGSDVQQVKWIYSLPLDIAIDPAGRNLYATNTNGKILRLSLNGEDFNANFITNLDAPKHIAVDAAGGKLYWTEADERIRRANLNGSNIQTVITGLGSPGGLTVAADKLYWTEHTGGNTGNIQCANLDGTNLQTLASLKSRPLGIAVNTSGRKVYWTNTTGRIQRANLNGKNIQNVVTGLSNPIDLVLGTDAAATSVAAAPAAVLPDATGVLPNYPNPFNPETWIPYQLAEPAEVTLHIYGVNGTLVRTLALGHQPAGSYKSRSRAVYWDGKNELSETVASGMYFYTLTAGDFTATRKMLIRK